MSVVRKPYPQSEVGSQPSDKRWEPHDHVNWWLGDSNERLTFPTVFMNTFSSFTYFLTNWASRNYLKLHDSVSPTSWCFWKGCVLLFNYRKSTILQFATLFTLGRSKHPWHTALIITATGNTSLSHPDEKSQMTVLAYFHGGIWQPLRTVSCGLHLKFTTTAVNRLQDRRQILYAQPMGNFA
jgi:hypothetical protein